MRINDWVSVSKSIHLGVSLSERKYPKFSGGLRIGVIL